MSKVKTIQITFIILQAIMREFVFFTPTWQRCIVANRSNLVLVFSHLAEIYEPQSFLAASPWRKQEVGYTIECQQQVPSSLSLGVAICLSFPLEYHMRISCWVAYTVTVPSHCKQVGPSPSITSFSCPFVILWMLLLCSDHEDLDEEKLNITYSYFCSFIPKSRIFSKTLLLLIFKTLLSHQLIMNPKYKFKS